jgi:hypothetical protein
MTPTLTNAHDILANVDHVQLDRMDLYESLALGCANPCAQVFANDFKQSNPGVQVCTGF